MRSRPSETNSNLVPTSSRRVDVFFYGFFMDADLLRSQGVNPEHVELGSVSGLELRIGQRAAIIAAPEGRVLGAIMSLTLQEIDRLYAEPSLMAYEPEAVLVELDRGGVVAALCYNLPVAPAPSEYNREYAAKLRKAAKKVGLPAAYIARIQS